MNCEFTTSTNSGPSAQESQRNIRLIELRNSLCTSEKRFASLARRFTKDSAPTRVTTAYPDPATTTDPESTSAPSSLSCGSDSPVSMDSSS